MNAADLQKTLQRLAIREKAVILSRFFKTGKGQYGEGDQFFGITVPQIRSVARAHRNLPLAECMKLLESPWHEVRVLGVVILTLQYPKADEKKKMEIYKLYLSQIGKGINNWDIVDISAPYIVGVHLLQRSRVDLEKLVRSSNLWKRRVAVVATFTFIRNNEFTPTLKFTEQLLTDKHDLMHKACGWMLREVGKRDPEILRAFLGEHAANMPRTMLRYAIEKFSDDERRAWRLTSK